MKTDLQKVRDWTEARIKAGNVPDWSWDHHVALLEAVDAVMHDISVANDVSTLPHRSFRNFRLVGREGKRDDEGRAASGSGTKQKAGGLH